MSKNRTENYKKHVGKIPGTLVYTGKKSDKNLVIESFDYNKEKVEETILLDIEDAIPYKDTESVTWININGLHYTKEIEVVRDGAFLRSGNLRWELVVNYSITWACR